MEQKIKRAKTDYDEVYEAGKQAEHDAFWDSSKTSEQFVYRFAGHCWNKDTFRPNYDLILKGNCYGCFYNNGARIDLVERLAELGKTMDTSKMTSGGYLFCDAAFTHIGVIDLTSLQKVELVFYRAADCITIDKVILKSDGSQTFSNAISLCHSLESITFEGTIGQNGFDIQWSTKLNKPSITSIVNALSTTTSGLTVTISKTAVDNAFGGSTSAEWLALVATRSNWTIALA